MLRPALVSILVLLASTSIRAQDVDVRFLPGDLLVSNGFERAPDGGSFWSRESSRIARRVDITSGLSIAGPLIARYDGAAVAMAWRASLWNERRRPVRRPTPPVLPPSPERYTWKFDKYAVGLNATGGGNDPALAVEMPDIIVLPDGRFRMYYAGPLSPSVSGARHAIKSAVSADGLNWTVESGIRLLGDGDGDGGPDGAPANEGVVNGPRVIRLSDGTYRMYYQANTLGFIPPDYRVKSATSTDGLTFAREGTRVDIHYPGGGPGQFSLAAHCAVIRVADDDFVILVSGNFDGKLGPSDLVVLALRVLQLDERVLVAALLGERRTEPGEGLALRETVSRSLPASGQGVDGGALTVCVLRRVERSARLGQQFVDRGGRMARVVAALTGFGQFGLRAASTVYL